MTFSDRARRAARLGLSRSLQLGTTPLRGAARAAIRANPDLEPKLADHAWLWQPGWGRSAHERLYSSPDPYGLETSAYEQAKFDLIIETLDGAPHGRMLEVGCAEGRLSERLVERSAEFVGVDISDAAVGRARERLAGEPRATFERRTLPLDMPEGTFDVIVCSDVLYYWEQATLRTGMARLVERLRPGGRMLLLHYLGDFGQANRGDAVHDLARRYAATDDGLVHLVEQYLAGAGPGGAGLRLDVLARGGAEPLPVPRPVPEPRSEQVPAQIPLQTPAPHAGSPTPLG